MPQQAQVDVGLPTPLPSGSLNSRFAKQAISPPLPPVQKGEQMNPLLQLGLGQLASSLYERSPAKPWVDKNVVDPVLNFIVPPAEASIDPTGGRSTAAFTGVKPSEAIQPPQAVSPNLPPVQVATDVTPEDEVSAEARIKDYTDAANFLEQGGEVPEGYDRESLIKDYRDAASYLESGILSLDELPRITAAEEAEGVEPFVGANRELFQAAASKISEETATKMAEQANQGDLEGALNTALEVKKEDVDKSDLSDEEKAEAKRDYEVFGGDPSSWLLDFGLAMMACNKPSFMECFGTAGLTAQQSAKERTKIKTEKELLSMKKLKGEIDLAKALKGDYDLKSMSFMNPETGQRDFGTVRQNKDSGKLEVLNPNGTVRFELDPVGAITLSSQADLPAGVAGFTKDDEKRWAELKLKKDGAIKFLGLAEQQKAAFQQGDIIQQPVIRELLITGKSIEEGLPVAAKMLGFGEMGIDDDLAQKLKSDPNYLDKYLPAYEGETKTFGEALGGNEAWKAANYALAMSLAASRNDTGRALSDADMQRYLTEVGAGVKTREGYIQTLDQLIQRTKDDVSSQYINFYRDTGNKDVADTFLSNYQGSGKGFWDFTFSQPEFQNLYGGLLYGSRRRAPAAPAATPGAVPPGANPYSQFDPAPTR